MCLHNFVMYKKKKRKRKKDRRATTLNRSFLSSQIILALPSEGEGGDKKETKLLGNRKKRDGSKRDLQPAVPTPLSLSLSLSSPPPLRFILRCSVIFLFQRFLFFSRFSFAPCARFVCLLSVSPGPRVCTLLRFTSSLSLFLLSRCHLFLLSLSLSLSIYLSFSLLLSYSFSS